MILFKGSSAPKSTSIEYIVVGLGNPGKQYENTRHNTGFIALDALAEKYNCSVNKLKYNALIGDTTICGHRVLLMKPQTFMNASGEAVLPAMQFYKIKPDHVIVMFDDISLDVGRMRVRRKGSDGGQKGMRSIIENSGSDMFPRVKMGIGEKPSPHWQLADWVLSRFTLGERKTLEQVAEKATGAVEEIIKGDIDKAMSLYNS